MPTRLAIRQEMQRRGLVHIGEATAAGAVNYITDTVRLRFGKMSPQEYGNAWIRITSGTYAGEVRQLERIDPVNGRAYFSPDLSGAHDSGGSYEIWKYGIEPDDVDRAIDRGQLRRCTRWFPRPLTVLTEVETWTGEIVGTETLAVNTLDFPSEFAEKSLQITNPASIGGAKSESYYVQPGARFDLFGLVSVRSGTGTIRVRRITSTAADIDLEGTAEFTLRGWQRFCVSFEIPDGCEEIQVWPGGAASAVTEWAAIGLRPTSGVWMPLSSRVRSEGDVGRIWAYDGINRPAYEGAPYELDGAQRRTVGDGVSLMIPRDIAGRPVYYDEVHHYAALATDYLTVSDRSTGDAVSTACPLRYAEAAAVCELLQHRNLDKYKELGRIYNGAVMELEIYGLQDGAAPIVIEEPRQIHHAIPFQR